MSCVHTVPRGALIVVALAGVAALRAQADQSDLRPAQVLLSSAGEPFQVERGAPFPSADWFAHADVNLPGTVASIRMV